jgi:hypothetical protein
MILSLLEDGQNLSLNKLAEKLMSLHYVVTLSGMPESTNFGGNDPQSHNPSKFNKINF